MTNTSIIVMIGIIVLIWLIASLLLMGLCRFMEPKWPKYPPLNIKTRMQADREERLKNEEIAREFAYAAEQRELRRQRREKKDRESLVSLSLK